MILEPGSKVLVAHRRLFETDHGRFFAAVVDGYEHGVARIRGYTWIRDGYTGDFKRKRGERTKIISISSGTVIVYLLDPATNIDELRITTENTNVVARDDSGFEMDLTEGVLHAAGGAAGQPPRGR